MTPKGAWPRSRVLLLKQWDRYPRSTERISCFRVNLESVQTRTSFLDCFMSDVTTVLATGNTAKQTLIGH